MAYTNQQLLVEIKRELSVRKKVYPDWVRRKRLTKSQSSKRIAIFEQLAEKLKKEIEDAEGNILSLFPENQTEDSNE